MTPEKAVKTIKEHIKKGYIVELSVDSHRPIYAVNMSAQHDVKRFTIPINKVSYDLLHKAVRGA